MSLAEYYDEKRRQEARERDEAWAMLSFREKFSYSWDLLKSYWRTFIWVGFLAGLLVVLANVFFSKMMSIEAIGVGGRGLAWSGAGGLDLLGIWVRNILVGFVFQASTVGVAALVLQVIDKGEPESSLTVFISPWERAGSLLIPITYWLAVDFIVMGAAAKLVQVPVLGIWLFLAGFFIVLAVNCCAIFYLADNYDVEFLESVFEPLKLVKMNPLAWGGVAGVLALSYFLPALLLVLGAFLPGLLYVLIVLPLALAAYICGPFFGLIFTGYTFKQTKADLELEENETIITLGGGGLR